MICLAQAELTQLLILKYCCMLMPSFARPDAARPYSWPSVFQSAKEVISWIRERVCGMRSLEPRIRTQNWQVTILRVFSTFWNWGRDLILNYCSKRNLSLLFWSGDKRTSDGMAPSSVSMKGKILSIRQPARSLSLSCGLWKFDSCGRGA
jgi:hypothetical protein